ncbi:MAG: DUF1565 domain-containing protein, partial [Methanomassiliicoccaceae archaeon]|nr:DUF1565 domain-containing protein [Methanomassiliicoccaceae archaeon]
MLTEVKKIFLISAIAVFVLAASFAALDSNDTYGAGVTTETELHDAIDAVVEGDTATIVISNDILLTERIYIANKDITLQGDGSGVILKRSANFASAIDQRGEFNPGLIEVASDINDSSKSASLTLINVTLDDNNCPDRTNYDLSLTPTYSTTDSPDWTQRVYDSVISAYSPYATINLGEGAKIINVGGAAAIRVLDAKVNLDSGSYVEGSNVYYKYTPSAPKFGAIWLQGDGAVLNFNTTMDGKTIVAPYIYSDVFAATVNFNGQVTNCTIQQPLFLTNANVGYTLTTSADSLISGNSIATNKNLINISYGSQNTIELNGKINDNKVGTDKSGNCIVYIGNVTDLDFSLYGEISGNNLVNQAISIFGTTNGTASLEAGSKISGNTVSIGAIYLNYAGNLQFNISGEISYNTSTANNAGALYATYSYPIIYLHDGALIKGNIAYGAGGGFYLNQYTTMIMDGGEISGNTAQCRDPADAGLSGGGGVAVARNAVFIMNGGTITGNTAGYEGISGVGSSVGIGGGVIVSGKTTNVATGGQFIMNGGEVSGNTLYSGTNGTDIAIGGSNFGIQSSTDKLQYIQIGTDAVIGTGNIGTGNYDATYTGPGVYLQNRSYTELVGAVLAPNQTTIAQRAIDSDPLYSGYSLVQNNGVWYYIDSAAVSSSLVVTYPQGMDIAKYFWIAAIQPMAGDGSLLGSQYLSVIVPTKTANGFGVTLDLIDYAGGDPVQGYSIVFLAEEKTNYMTLDVESSGSGQFYIDSAGGPLYQIEVGPGDTVDSFVITSTPGWKIESIILTAGDGTKIDKTNDALITVDYSELASGTNVIKVVFVSTAVHSGNNIYASADGGSEISPSGTVSVSTGNNARFTFSAKAGFEITAVLVDGKAISAGDLATGEYIFRAVVGDHTIEVVSKASGGSSDGGGTEPGGKDSGTSGGNWAVLNIICAIFAVLAGLI